MPGTTLLTRCPVVPVVVIDDAAQALPLGRALLAGGIDVVEITLRTSAGLDAIRALASLEGLQVGAGSVLVPRQVDQVVDAGAEFVVSPGLSRGVLDRCRALGVPALPGVATGSELMVAAELGLTEVKFFPAGLLGGPAGIKALAAPFTGISFMPSGGVNQDNLAEYLALPAVPAVSGSWMVEPALLAAGRWDEVTERSAAAVERAAKA
ncbi:bifunctional 4-hydroxy-2-oxoglutarate aldolase/2-dehydro-3-deoxy-phosphogluconate aldolase [Streptomyces sp. 8K308]|uniref:bifunctional 4-hydroxy-2-oxoglutarate aldolase/2-dehydro-3-deoxy-phosphogluconate aldolase n=1 Tax=Streptomyces sp. 8K308 TaxID=2530388 RepID=UPI001051E582|nr:bifunctional 4-hydroxy-2-oxoglutarate aldolase/2-dehydro-3-deoxy-phosphogluconate aldolase [Streptomyces sp. 8K308]TDC27724.1 bifunctional 4-hydroxy-2-oxoglutarate aldolase/2-dehydro-3-deoxy-phosphogluconate aldolase [Streptomyces sp. 8K308]